MDLLRNTSIDIFILKFYFKSMFSNFTSLLL